MHSSTCQKFDVSRLLCDKWMCSKTDILSIFTRKEKTMKKLFLCISVALLFEMGNVQAANHEVSVSYGIATHNSFIGSVESIGTGLFSLGTSKVDYSYSGTLNLGYKFQPIKYVGLETVVNYESGNGKMYSKNELTGNSNVTHYSVIESVCLSWFNFKHVGMYSKLGVSYTVRKTQYDFVDKSKTLDTKNESYWWFQITPVAIEVGSENLRAFTELGIGSQGLLAVGLKYKF